MQKIKRILRLSLKAGRSQREVARASGLSQPSVQRALQEDLDEEALAERLYGKRRSGAAARARGAQPDFQGVRNNLKKYGHVTLERLWQEYREGTPEGYSHFWALYARWLQGRDPVLRQDHNAGDTLFIDYAGLTVTVYAPEGEFEAQLVGWWRAGSSSSCTGR